MIGPVRNDWLVNVIAAVGNYGEIFETEHRREHARWVWQRGLNGPCGPKAAVQYAMLSKTEWVEDRGVGLCPTPRFFSDTSRITNPFPFVRPLRTAHGPIIPGERMADISEPPRGELSVEANCSTMPAIARWTIQAIAGPSLLDCAPAGGAVVNNAVSTGRPGQRYQVLLSCYWSGPPGLTTIQTSAHFLYIARYACPRWHSLGISSTTALVAFSRLHFSLLSSASSHGRAAPVQQTGFVSRS